MMWLEEYARMIESGEVVAGYFIKKEIHNLIEDLSNPRFFYDTSEAEKRIRFMETMCLQSKQPYYMKPLSLMPWQKAFFEALYSFRIKETGRRRFTEALLFVARKNGKSSMLAADGMYDLFVGEGGADICCASSDDRTAKIIWDEIAGMRSRLDPKKVLTGQNLTEVKNLKNAIRVFRLTSRMNLDGFNLSKVYLDESHNIAEENGQSEVAEACWRGMSSKQEPLFINCTTQGFNRDCYLDHKLDHARQVIRGEVEDVNFLPFLFEQDSESEVWQDEKTWEKSNPSMRYGVKQVEKLRRDVELAKSDKATRIHLLTKDFNIEQSTAQGWLMLEDYDYPQQAFDLADFRGSFCLGAVDLSATTDLSSARLLLMKPNDKTKYFLTMYFLPESKLTASDDKDAGADYAEWAREGYVTVCEGNEVNLESVADWIFSTCRTYGLKPYKVGYDERFSKPFLNRCDEYGIETEMVWQGRGLSNAMKLTEADLKSRALNYANNPVDKWCLGNCCCAVDNFGNIQAVKNRTQKTRRIDGAITLIMANEMLRRYAGDFKKLIGGD